MGCTYRKYNVNENYFKTFSADMCYILGLILSDGNIRWSSKRKGPVLRISSINYKLLDDVRNSMDSTHIIRKESNKNGEWYTLSIYSKEIVKDLMLLGITENKSLTCYIPPSIPLNFTRDFIRGYFDGDGSIYKALRNDSYIHGIKIEIATGSQLMKDQLLFILNKITTNNKGSFTEHINNSNVYVVRGNSTVAEILFDYMYYNHCICFTDKYIKYKNLIESRADYFNKKSIPLTI